MTTTPLHRVLVALVAMAVATAHAEPAPARAASSEVAHVYVLRRPGVVAYEEIVREFLDSCRVHAQLLILDDSNAAALRDAFRTADVVVAVGQRAVNAMVGTKARVISALALSQPRGVIAADVLPPPELSLKALLAAHPRVSRIGVVYSPAVKPLVARVAAHQQRLGFKLVEISAGDGPAAVRALREAADQLDALWLAPDLNVLTPQLFQYALMLELERGIPMVAVTRQQVQSGALLAYDTDPHAIGRQAADLTHRLLAGTPTQELLTSDREHTSIELTVNGDVADRLGSDRKALGVLEARFER